MRKDTDPTVPDREPARDTGALLLAATGFAAAFGAASCCALPLLLGSIGLGGAWFLALAWIAAPHRIALLAVAVICLAGGALLLWQRRRTSRVPDAAPRRRSALVALATGVLSLGAVLVVLGFLYA
jgi:mercuric ion transport protein